MQFPEQNPVLEAPESAGSTSTSCGGVLEDLIVQSLGLYSQAFQQRKLRRASLTNTHTYLSHLEQIMAR